ncbi:MAG: sigma 54-interacting transcriptional regulator [Spirochaetaceae bacterium]|jgi:Nif-specific regulatory protein|nr:sigma 54-interacting transcriptional regulator [Spirochaetaceae bacterium]
MDQTMLLKSGDRAELELLFDITRILNKHVELRVALGPILSMIKIRRGLKNSMVTLLDRATGLLKIEEAEGLTEEEKERGIYRLGEGLVGRVFESGIAIVSKDLSKEVPFRSRADMAGMSYICVPICSHNALIGTLSAERRLVRAEKKPPEKQVADDKAFLEKVALLIADSAKLRERIMEEALRQDRENRRIGSINMHRKKHGGDIFGSIACGSGIIGTSGAIRDVYQIITQAAPSDAAILIEGECGTGKELVAAEIVKLSKRSGAPFLKLNCAVLPESIIESELFGHEKGAFPGALKQRSGRFELAHKGTIFLDEIAELSPQIQIKLLRVLQERELERVGDTARIKVDVRLIAASSKALEKEMRAGRFCEELFSRLNVFPIRLPPLRERKGDIMLLADYFIERSAEKNGKQIKRISGPAIDLLTSHTWHGNVRELENCIERAVMLSTDMVIHSYHLPPSLQTATSTDTQANMTLEPALSRLEKEMILEALKLSGGNISAAARDLGISERQMGLRVQHYGINRRTFRKTPKR